MVKSDQQNLVCGVGDCDQFDESVSHPSWQREAVNSFPNKNKAETLGNHIHVSREGPVIDCSRTSNQSSREMLDVGI